MEEIMLQKNNLFDLVEDLFNRIKPEVDDRSQYEDFTGELPLPGLTKNDFVVEIKGNSLLISVNDLPDAQGYISRYSGRKFVYHLTHYHDLNKTDAIMENGLLKLMVPLKSELKNPERKITVK